MKHLIVIILGIVFCNFCTGQQIRFNYFSTFAGRNFTAQYGLELKSSELLIGVGYNSNRFVDNFNRNQAFFKRLHASSMSERINLNIAYTKILNKNNQFFDLSLLLDFQVKRSPVKTVVFLPESFDSTLVINRPEEGILYRELVLKTLPYFWFESTIGLQTKFPLSVDFKLVQQAGLGLTYLQGRQDEFILPSSDWGLHYFIGIGVEYRLRKRKKK